MSNRASSLNVPSLPRSQLDEYTPAPPLPPPPPPLAVQCAHAAQEHGRVEYESLLEIITARDVRGAHAFRQRTVDEGADFDELFPCVDNTARKRDFGGTLVSHFRLRSILLIITFFLLSFSFFFSRSLIYLFYLFRSGLSFWRNQNESADVHILHPSPPLPPIPPTNGAFPLHRTYSPRLINKPVKIDEHHQRVVESTPRRLSIGVIMIRKNDECRPDFFEGRAELFLWLFVMIADAKNILKTCAISQIYDPLVEACQHIIVRSRAE